MTFYIAHISDIHISPASNLDSLKLRRLARAIAAHAPKGSTIVIAVTGDIVYSGAAGEYAIAREAFQVLLSDLLDPSAELKIETLFVPGNHDCNFKNDTPARQRLLASLAAEVPASSDFETARVCAAVQAEFREFTSECGGHTFDGSSFYMG